MSKTISLEGRTVLDPQIYLISDKETGEDRVLPSPSDLKRQELWAKATLDECAAAIATANEQELSDADPDRVTAESKKLYAERLVAELAVIRKHRDNLVEKAVKQDIRVIKPTYSELLKAEGDATTLDEGTGAIRTDRRKMLADLISTCVIDGGNARVGLSDLEPSVGKYLESFIGRIAFPEEGRIPFYLASAAMQ